MRLLDLGRLAARVAARKALAAASAASGRSWHNPVRVTFTISTVCNLRCIHCAIWRGKADPAALTLAQWQDALRGLSEWLGPFALSFASGEPLLSPHFFPLVEQAARLGVMTSCTTNATLIRGETAHRLRDSGLTHLFISLDGIEQATHDAGRGVPGTYAKAREALVLLKDGGGPAVFLNTIVAGHNLDELEPLVRFAAAERLAGVSFQALADFGENWQDLWPKDQARLAKTLDRLAALKSAGLPVRNSFGQLEAMKRYFADPQVQFPGRRCGTEQSLVVMNDGTVFMCRFKEPVGSLREKRLEDIWRSPQALRRLLEIQGCKKSCMLTNCHFEPGWRSRATQMLRMAGSRLGQA